MKKIALSVATLCLAAGSLTAAEPTVMHCFAYHTYQGSDASGLGCVLQSD